MRFDIINPESLDFIIKKKTSLIILIVKPLSGVKMLKSTNVYRTKPLEFTIPSIFRPSSIRVGFHFLMFILFDGKILVGIESYETWRAPTKGRIQSRPQPPQVPVDLRRGEGLYSTEERVFV